MGKKICLSRVPIFLTKGVPCQCRRPHSGPALLTTKHPRELFHGAHVPPDSNPLLLWHLCAPLTSNLTSQLQIKQLKELPNPLKGILKAVKHRRPLARLPRCTTPFTIMPVGPGIHQVSKSNWLSRAGTAQTEGAMCSSHLPGITESRRILSFILTTKCYSILTLHLAFATSLCSLLT